MSTLPRRIKASVSPDLGQQLSGLLQQNPTSGDSGTGFADQTLRASAGLEKMFQVELNARRAQIIHDAEHRGKPHVPFSRQTAPALPCQLSAADAAQGGQERRTSGTTCA
ncbi:hypothetical protein, partial [Mesorhizobium sp.]